MDVGEFFLRVVSHAKQAPIEDPWADFVAKVITMPVA
jgi:hypothetical protein